MKIPSYFFNIESRKSKSGEGLIYLNLTYGYKEGGGKYRPMRISTGWRILPEHWDIENKKPSQKFNRKYGNDLADAIERVRKTSFDQLSIYRNEYKTDPHPNELKDLIQIELGRSKKPSDITRIATFINTQTTHRTSLEPNNSLHWSDNTRKQYDNLERQIELFETKTGESLSFEKITEKQYWRFLSFLSQDSFETTGKALKVNTIAKASSKLKAVFNMAVEENITIGMNFRKGSLKVHEVEASYDTYLNSIQLKKIIDSDVSHSKEFTHAKNFIILSSFTGLRIGDVEHLHELKIEEMVSNNNKFEGLITKVRKTRKNGVDLLVALPVLNPVHEIYKTHRGFPKFPSQTNIRKSITKYLKFMDYHDDVIVTHKYYGYPEKTELKPQYSMFSPHDARRTFVTNLRQIGIVDEVIEPISHPKHKFSNILDKYDKSNLYDKAYGLRVELDTKSNNVFR